MTEYEAKEQWMQEIPKSEASKGLFIDKSSLDDFHNDMYNYLAKICSCLCYISV